MDMGYRNDWGRYNSPYGDAKGYGNGKGNGKGGYQNYGGKGAGYAPRPNFGGGPYNANNGGAGAPPQMLNEAEFSMGEMQSFGKVACLANNLSWFAEESNVQDPGNAAAYTNLLPKGPPPPEDCQVLVKKLEKVVDQAPGYGASAHGASSYGGKHGTGGGVVEPPKYKPVFTNGSNVDNGLPPGQNGAN
eukprot:9822617-Karenia_brevis.AAC.1